jgi:membrane-associated phospholipid phosphatase
MHIRASEIGLSCQPAGAALRERWKAALCCVGASLVNAILKIILHRPRPQVVPHLAMVSNAGLPSVHAMISAAVYLALGIMLAETQTRAAPRAFIVGFAASFS